MISDSSFWCSQDTVVKVHFLGNEPSIADFIKLIRREVFNFVDDEKGVDSTDLVEVLNN